MPLDAPQPVLDFSREFACIHCAYDLRTIPLSAPCPECGRPSADSLDSLPAAVPRDLARVRLGVLLMALAASVVPLVSMAIMFSAAVGAARFGGAMMMGLSTMAGFGIGVLGPSIASAGVFLLSANIRRGTPLGPPPAPVSPR